MKRTKSRAVGVLVSLVATAALLGGFGTRAARAEDKPMIEIGAYGGGAAGWSAGPGFAGLPEGDPGLAGGGYAGARASFSFLFVQAEADFAYFNHANHDEFQLSAAAGVLFLKLHEFFLRRGSPHGEHLHAFAGIGYDFDLPRDLGYATASAGAMFTEWQRPGAETEQNMMGLYAGGAIVVKAWRIENELRVAYYWSPEVDMDRIQNDAIGGAIDPQNPQNYDWVDGWKHGIMASNRFYVEVLRFSAGSLGPELTARLNQLPDATEVVATVGLAGKLGW